MAPQRSALQATINMTAAGSPPWRSSAGSDSRQRPAPADIAAGDWDLLFRAALELLARVAAEKAATDDTVLRLQPAGTALRECIDALDWLRRTVPVPSGIGVQRNHLDDA